MSKKGIDLSNWQATLTNFEGLRAAGIEFAIIKITEGTAYKSPSFEKQYNGLRAAGIPVGVYIYTHASTREAVQNELTFALQALGNRKLQLPVFLDMEANGLTNYMDVALHFGECCTAAGLRWGIYANKFWFVHYLDPTKIKAAGGAIWVAQYNTNCAVELADIWQFSNDGRLHGYSGAIDMNELLNPALIRNEEPPQPAATAGTQSAAPRYDGKIAALQGIMYLDGYWEKNANGIPTPEFCDCLKQYADAIKGNIK